MTAISWKTGQSDLWTDPAAWSTGTVPGSADDVSIAVAPSASGLPYVVTLLSNQSAHSITQSEAESTIAVSECSLTVAGMYALGGILSLDQGTFVGSTVISTGGIVLLAGDNAISGVSWHGTLSLAQAVYSPYYTSVELTSDRFTGAGGTGAGSIDLGTGVQALVDPTTSLANVAIVMNGAALVQSNGTLTIGSLSTIAASGACSIGASGGAMTNAGTISAAGAGTSVTIAASSFSGGGTISVSNGASVFLAGGSVTDAGLLSVGAGSYLDVQSTDGAGLFQNTRFQVQGGTLSLDASLTSAQLATLDIASGTLALSGTLQNAGSTLDPSASSSLANLDLAGGTITGGTIVNQGAFSVGANAPQSVYSLTGTSQMTGVTFEGPLDVGRAAQLNLSGFTLTGAGGSGQGSIVIATTAVVTVLDDETLNAAISIGTDNLYTYASSGLYAAGTLTIGAQSVTTVTETNATIAGSGQSGVVVNLGAIDVTATAATLALYDVVNKGQIAVTAGALLVQNMTNTGTVSVTSGGLDESGPLLNAGLISVSGTGSSENSYGYTSGLNNAGTLSLSNGATAYLGSYGTDWTNAGTLLVANADLSLGGTFTTAQLGNLQAGQTGTVGLLGTLVNTGIFSVGQGTSLSALDLDGVIRGGTVIDTGGGLIGQGGILSDVAFDGTLALTQGQSYLYIDNGTSFAGRSGGNGSLSITGSASSLTADGNITLDHVAISLGNSTGAAALAALYGDTLTLGTTTTVTQTGALADLGAVPYGSGPGTVLNQGVVTADLAGGTLSLMGLLTNAGTIAVSNGDTLALSVDSLANTGVISVTNATADVQSATLAQLSELQLTDSALTVTGVLTAAGGTLSVGAGGFAPLLQLEGIVRGGTLHDAGGDVQFAGSATLDGVIYQGVMAVNRPLSTVTVLDGLALQGVQGSGAGSLALTGAGSTLVWGRTQALDNATLSIGSNGTSYGGHIIAAPSLVAEISPTLDPPVLLGRHLHIVQAGLYADIGSSYGTFSSAATLTANVAHGQFLLQGTSFSNTGTVGVSGTDNLLIDSETFTNTGLMVIATGSAVNLDLYNYFAQGSLAAQSFTNAGTLMMAGGMLMELTDNGAFPNVPLLNAPSGHIVGAGVVASQIDNTGTIEARGGVLNLVQAVSGTGALQVDSGAMLVLGGVGTGQTVGFSGTGGVLGLQPAYFLGTIGGFASGDTIDLFNTSAHSAAFSGDSILVMLSNGGTLHLATTSALTGSLTVTAGTHGDELIRFAAGAGVPAAHAAAATDAPVPFARQAELSVPIGQALGLSHFSHIA